MQSRQRSNFSEAVQQMNILNFRGRHIYCDGLFLIGIA